MDDDAVDLVVRACGCTLADADSDADAAFLPDADDAADTADDAIKGGGKTVVAA
jgi:hypothetical protein